MANLFIITNESHTYETHAADQLVLNFKFEKIRNRLLIIRARHAFKIV